MENEYSSPEQNAAEQRKPVRNSKAIIISIFSLISYIASPAYIIIMLILGIEYRNKIFEKLLFQAPYALIPFCLHIAAWVLMIIARVRYKECIFAKILMWFYIGVVLVFMVLVIALHSYLSSCYFPG
ncbi:MAG: hypothetical protein J5715_07315 [Clostridiales bacterium]|nr:hypothetical protein [Clostridiales bacterium]